MAYMSQEGYDKIVAEHRQRADHVEGGDDQHGKQRQDVLHHRERERGKPA